MERLPNLSAINTNIIEGRLLIAALSKLSVGEKGDFPADIVLGEIQDLAEKIYADAPDIPSPEVYKKPMFEEAIRDILNSYSMENRSDTPDYILAQYLANCLGAYESCVKSRDKWFGVDMWAEDKKRLPEEDFPWPQQ